MNILFTKKKKINRSFCLVLGQGLVKLSYNLFKTINFYKLTSLNLLGGFFICFDRLFLNINFNLFFCVYKNLFLNLVILKKKFFLSFDLAYLRYYLNFSKVFFFKLYSFLFFLSNFIFNKVY